MRWVFCINFRGLYLASEDTSRDAVFAALIFERGRTRQSDKNRGSIIRVTGPLTTVHGSHGHETCESTSECVPFLVVGSCALPQEKLCRNCSEKCSEKRRDEIRRKIRAEYNLDWIR